MVLGGNMDRLFQHLPYMKVSKKRKITPRKAKIQCRWRILGWAYEYDDSQFREKEPEKAP